MADALGPCPEKTRPRFGWAMRLFLGILLFDMIFHSLASLIDYKDWLKERDLARMPRGLPAWEEIGVLEGKAGPANPAPVADRVLESLDSVWDFFKPWPPRNARHKLQSWDEKGMYALAWLTSRLDFFENLAGVPQRWTMFSPNASRSASVARIRLLFQDGSMQIVRLTADPEDLTRYSHWFQEKVLDYELKVIGDWDSRLGYCNYLSHHYSRNARGSPLDKIYIYKIRYQYPAPDEDAVKVLADQSGPPNWDREGPIHVFDVASKKMRKLGDEERKAAQKRLGK